MLRSSWNTDKDEQVFSSFIHCGHYAEDIERDKCRGAKKTILNPPQTVEQVKTDFEPWVKSRKKFQGIQSAGIHQMHERIASNFCGCLYWLQDHLSLIRLHSFQLGMSMVLHPLARKHGPSFLT